MSHQWVYRNPYDRTCARCQRHEVEHGLPDGCGGTQHRYQWWEVFSHGNGSRRCRYTALGWWLATLVGREGPRRRKGNK